MYKKNFEPKFNKTTGAIIGYKIGYFNCISQTNPLFPLIWRMEYEADKSTGLVDRNSIRLFKFWVEGDVPYIPAPGAPEPFGPTSKFFQNIQSEHNKVHMSGKFH